MIGRLEEGDVPPVFHCSSVSVLGLAFEYMRPLKDTQFSVGERGADDV